MSFLDNIGLDKYTAKVKSLLNGYVPTTRTVNGKALSSNITLSASDVASLPITGGTLTGNLIIKNSTAYGTKINLGDGDYVHLSEPEDDCLEIKAKKVNFVLSDSTDTKFTVNGANPFNAVDMSLYAPKTSPDFTGSISMHRKAETTVGTRSTAFGDACEASGYASHAEGSYSAATNYAAHAEGYGAVASGSGAHAEGQQTAASGDNSHAEGYITSASNVASHACGKHNKAMTSVGTVHDQIGDVFVVGNGTGGSDANALRLAYEGTLYLTKAYKSTGADYAEYFEWLDGNPDGEDRVGRFVTLDGTKIRYANEGDYVLGVVSGQPCIIGNADEDWLGRWVHDDFNRFVKEYLLMHEVEVTPPQDATEDELTRWLLDNEIKEREGKYFKMEEEVVDYPTPHWRHKANPSYDATQPYIERQDRKEWDAVGMVGVLSVIDDGSCQQNSYCKVSTSGIATASETYIPRQTFRVVSRVSENIIKVLLL